MGACLRLPGRGGGGGGQASHKIPEVSGVPSSITLWWLKDEVTGREKAGLRKQPPEAALVQYKCVGRVLIGLGGCFWSVTRQLVLL